MNGLYMIRIFVVLCGWMSFLSSVSAQSRSTQPIQVVVSPNKLDWVYSLGETVHFSVTVLKHQVPIEDVDVKYTVGLEKMPPLSTGNIVAKSFSISLGDGTTLQEPGFLRCEARATIDGVEYRGIATVAFAPDRILPTQYEPTDFWEYWKESKAVAAKVPMDVKRTLLPDRCTEKVDVYQVNIQHYELGSRLYGILAVPKGEGKFPAVLQLPGAAVRSYPGIVDLAEKGMITLQIGIHCLPLTYEQPMYDGLRWGTLKDYWFFNLDDRDKYYYKRVYMGCLRAVDYLFAMPEFDGSNLVAWGGSQGGALAIVTAALDDRVKYLVALYPALCDLTGYLHGRAGGWPHMFHEANTRFLRKEEKVKVSAYYDVVNFARGVKVPGFYTWGYNDEVCPPTSYYAAYNQIVADKECYVIPETGHWTYPVQTQKIYSWLSDKLLQ